jgi:hypothetical protein
MPVVRSFLRADNYSLINKEMSLDPSRLCMGMKLEKLASGGSVISSLMSGTVTALIWIRMPVKVAPLYIFLSDWAMGW